jgi:hypothetical protein
MAGNLVSRVFPFGPKLARSLSKPRSWTHLKTLAVAQCKDMMRVVIHGTFIIRIGVLDTKLFPGRAMRAPIQETRFERDTVRETQRERRLLEIESGF